MTTKQNHDSVRLSRNEAKKKNVLSAAVVALEDGVSERAAGVELNFFVPCSDEVVNDVGGRGVASGAAEPLAAR